MARLAPASFLAESHLGARPSTLEDSLKKIWAVVVVEVARAKRKRRFYEKGTVEGSPSAHLRPGNEGERARKRRARSPCAHPAREVGVLKRHGIGEGESELGADFTLFS
jgi:hypothetical protein